MHHLTNIGCGLIVLAFVKLLLPHFITDLNALVWMTGWLTCYFMFFSRM